MARVLRCQRCDRRYRGSGEWNCTLVDGVALAALCPTCQTPEENAEAVVHESTTYGRDDLGRVVGRTK